MAAIKYRIGLALIILLLSILLVPYLSGCEKEDGANQGSSGTSEMIEATKLVPSTDSRDDEALLESEMLDDTLTPLRNSDAQYEYIYPVKGVYVAESPDSPVQKVVIYTGVSTEGNYISLDTGEKVKAPCVIVNGTIEFANGDKSYMGFRIGSEEEIGSGVYSLGGSTEYAVDLLKKGTVNSKGNVVPWIGDTMDNISEIILDTSDFGEGILYLTYVGVNEVVSDGFDPSFEATSKNEYFALVRQ